MAYLCGVCGKPTAPSEGVCVRCGSVKDIHVCEDGHEMCQSCLDDDVMNRIVSFCETSDSKDPYEIFDSLVDIPGMRMHDFKHHVAVGASLIAAYCNVMHDDRKSDLLQKMSERGRKVPPGSCGLMGNCGAAVSVGTFVSLITGTTPYSDKTWAEANRATAEPLLKMAEIGGPRCCKRNSYIALGVGDDCASRFGCELDLPEEVICKRHDDNKECIKERCPYYAETS